MVLSQQLVVFSLDEQRYGLDLVATERVLAAVEITLLPKAPSIVLGIFSLHGRIVPVVNVRRRFRLPQRELRPGDQLIVARAAGRTVALAVDATHGVVEVQTAGVVTPAAILPDLPFVRGVAQLPDGLVLLHDLTTFLALDEAEALDDALRATEGVAAR
jgi:purine-binding chemotaxis protein CheW